MRCGKKAGWLAEAPPGTGRRKSDAPPAFVSIRRGSRRGELILRRAENLKQQFGDDVRIGRCAGFDLFLRPGFNDAVEVIVRRQNSYSARVTDTAQGTIRSLDATVLARAFNRGLIA